MIIDCISDLHGAYPILEGGDLLIIAGDLTARHTKRELDDFNSWVKELPYDKKIVIAGNHDAFFDPRVFDPEVHLDGTFCSVGGYDYLCDSALEWNGLKIWGSPWSLWFHGINPKCKVFATTEKVLSKRYQLIPQDIDILITHQPPYGVLDYIDDKHLGSSSLRMHFERIKPKLHVFGHIHEHGGKVLNIGTSKFINASIMNEDYEPVNGPCRVYL